MIICYLPVYKYVSSDVSVVKLTTNKNHSIQQHNSIQSHIIRNFNQLLIIFQNQISIVYIGQSIFKFYHIDIEITHLISIILQYIISKYFDIMMPSTDLIGLLLLAALISGIQIPLRQGQSKCMLVYTTAHEETIKIDIDFPYVSGWG